MSDEGGTLVIYERDALSDGERADLEAFIDAASSAIADQRGDRMTPVLDILRVYARQGGSEEDAIATGKLYAMTLAPMPWWAIHAACEDFRMGRLANASPTFKPSPTVLLQGAEKHVGELRAKQWRARRLLKARPIPNPVGPKDKDRFSDRLAGVVNAIKGAPDPIPPRHTMKLSPEKQAWEELHAAKNGLREALERHERVASGDGSQWEPFLAEHGLRIAAERLEKAEAAVDVAGLRADDDKGAGE